MCRVISGKLCKEILKSKTKKYFLVGLYLNIPLFVYEYGVTYYASHDLFSLFDNKME